MRTRNSLRNLRDLVLLLAALALLSLINAAAQAQTVPAPLTLAQSPASTPVTSAFKPVARDSELYCAGYIETNPGYGGLSLVGGGTSTLPFARSGRSSSPSTPRPHVSSPSAPTRGRSRS